MLPSMPILFTRESQDAFGNKIEPSTSFFSQNLPPKPATKVEVPEKPPPPVEEPPKVQNETKTKKEPEKKKKNDPPSLDDNALEDALVKSYYSRIQSRFATNASAPTNKYVQFQNILREFDPNKESPVELYRRIEKLFGRDSDIAEDFLLFLKPGQAVQVGRFMDRFMLSQITLFNEELHRTFSRKPTVLRKVVRAITTGVKSGNGADVKARVLPHFRAHPRLMEMFRMLLPDERPPECLYESGTDHINESILVADKYDVIEFDTDVENKQKQPTKKGLDAVYLNGRVFLQHGKMLRPARVTFPYSKEPYRAHARRLAPPSPPTHPAPPDHQPQKRARKQKSPTKKDVNDNNKKETTISPKPKKQKRNCKEKQEKNKRERKDSKSVAKKDVTEPLKAKQAKLEPSVSEKSNAKSNNNPQCTSSNWTRDEDKTMLQVLKGEAGSEKVFCRINELLPHRTPTEIKERFSHVMSLLQQMAVSEVT